MFRSKYDLCTWFSKTGVKIVYDSFKYGPSKADKRVNDMQCCLIKADASHDFESCKNPALEVFKNSSKWRWIFTDLHKSMCLQIVL